MSKFNLLNTPMTSSEATEYLELIQDNLDEIYMAYEPPSGKAGTIWRYFWGNPRSITPLTLYLRGIFRAEIDASEILLKEQAKRLSTKSQEKTKKLVQKEQSKNIELSSNCNYLIRENGKLKSQQKGGRTELRRLRLKEMAGNHPSMVDAQARDINFLVNRLKEYTSINLEELESYRLQQQLKDDL
jgi:hypothetical protein